MSNTPSLTFRRTSSGSPADTGDASAEAAERKAKLLQRRAKLMSEVQVLRVTVQREGQDASESEEKGEEGDGPSSPEGVVEVRRQKKRPMKSAAVIPTDSEDAAYANPPISVESSDDAGHPPRNRPRTEERWAVTDQPCGSCSKAKKRCMKSDSARRSACRACSRQKKQCVWPGTVPVKGKQVAGRSPKPTEAPEPVPDYSVSQSIQDVRKDLVSMRAELVGVRGEVVSLKSGQAKILAQQAEAKKQMDRMEELLRSMLVKGGDDMDIST